MHRALSSKYMEKGLALASMQLVLPTVHPEEQKPEYLEQCGRPTLGSTLVQEPAAAKLPGPFGAGHRSIFKAVLTSTLCLMAIVRHPPFPLLMPMSAAQKMVETPLSST